MSSKETRQVMYIEIVTKECLSPNMLPEEIRQQVVDELKR